MNWTDLQGVRAQKPGSRASKLHGYRRGHMTVLLDIFVIGAFTSMPREKILRPALGSSSVKIDMWLGQGLLAISGGQESKVKCSVPPVLCVFLFVCLFSFLFFLMVTWRGHLRSRLGVSCAL